MESEGITHRTRPVNGIDMHVAEKGEGGPVVLLLHDFPELWYSWRHQILGLAARGYPSSLPRAPRLRRHVGASSASLYTVLHLIGGLVGIIDALGQEQVFVVGNDWGAFMGWHLSLSRPDKVKALVSMTVLYAPRNPVMKPLDFFKENYGNDHYILRFQKLEFQNRAIAISCTKLH